MACAVTTSTVKLHDASDGVSAARVIKQARSCPGPCRLRTRVTIRNLAAA